MLRLLNLYGKPISQVAFALVVFSSGVAQTDSLPGCEWTQFTFESGAVSSEGCLVDGKPEGIWKTYHPSGLLASEGARRSHELEGVWRFYHEGGWLEHEVPYAQGRLNGTERFFSADGVLFEEKSWVQGVQEGLARTYFNNGNVQKEVPFEGGREQGLGWEYDAADGRPISRLDFHNGYLRGVERINRYNDAGRKKGVWLVWNANGVLIEEGPWTNGQRHGVFTFYDNKGKLDRLERYVYGELQADDETTQLLDIRRTYHENGQVARVGGYGEQGPEGVFREYDLEGNLVGGAVYQNGTQVAEGITEANGLRSGAWKLFYDSGELFGEGGYEEGLREGAWRFYNRDGSLAQEGNYRAGNYHGDWTWYYPNGDIHRRESYRKGKEDGLFQEWNVDGELLLEGDYVDGLRNGVWVTQVNDHREEGAYIDGERHSEWIHTFDNGQKQFQGSYDQGIPLGKHFAWNRDGTRNWVGTYEGGLPDGDWTYYGDNNQIVQVRTYRMGELIKVDGIKVDRQ